MGRRGRDGRRKARRHDDGALVALSLANEARRNLESVASPYIVEADRATNCVALPVSVRKQKVSWTTLVSAISVVSSLLAFAAHLCVVSEHFSPRQDLVAPQPAVKPLNTPTAAGPDLTPRSKTSYVFVVALRPDAGDVAPSSAGRLKEQRLLPWMTDGDSPSTRMQGSSLEYDALSRRQIKPAMNMAPKDDNPLAPISSAVDSATATGL